MMNLTLYIFGARYTSSRGKLVPVVGSLPAKPFGWGLSRYIEDKMINANKLREIGEIHDKLVKYRGTNISLPYIVSRCSDIAEISRYFPLLWYHTMTLEKQKHNIEPTIYYTNKINY